MVWVLVLLVRAVVEAVTECPVVNAAEPASPVWPGTSEPLHMIWRPGTLYKKVYFLVKKCHVMFIQNQTFKVKK